jgi:hypothetical protein
MRSRTWWLIKNFYRYKTVGSVGKLHGAAAGWSLVCDSTLSYDNVAEPISLDIGKLAASKGHG